MKHTSLNSNFGLSIKHYHFKWVILLWFVLSYLAAFGQRNSSLITRAESDVVSLIKNTFIKGNCANVSNIQAIGPRLGTGEFENAASVIGMETGIILTTGKVEDAMGPNDDNETSFRYNDFSGDKDLSKIATSTMADAVGIEFDFVPIGNTVSFNYVFASEEYCEFVNSIFNDVFGFFVSGPGIEGDFSDNAINVARIGSDNEEFVAINTVNSGRNSGSYIQNEGIEDSNICGIQFAPQYPEEIEYDGFTIRLRASFEVTPCETYHIRLVVGDVGDDKLDSAVFLEAKSFDLGDAVSVTANVVGNDSAIAFENCIDGEFIFERARNMDISQAQEVNFSITGSATSDLDYETVPFSITIPAQQTKASLPIQVIADQIDEDLEFIFVELEYECICIPSDTSRLFISDLVAIEASFTEETLVCAGQEFSISPTVKNAVEPLRYQWDVGDTTAFLTRMVSEPFHYVVTVTDACGRRDSVLAEIKLQEIPMAILGGETFWCDGGDPVFLDLDLEGQSPWSLTYSVNGENTNLTDIQQNPFRLPVDQAGIYELLQFQDAHCIGVGTGIVEVEQKGVQTAIEITPIQCTGTKNGSIRVDILEGLSPFEIEWQDFLHDSLDVTQLASGTYKLSITDASGCTVQQSIRVPILDPVPLSCSINPEEVIFVPNAFSPNQDTNNEVFQVYAKSNVIQSLSFQILDRWGNLLFQSREFPPSDGSVSWDGDSAAIGVYVCIVKIKLTDGSLEYLAKDVTLVR